MAKATFEDLKSEVAIKAEEAGVLPTSVVMGGVQYTLQMPAETKMAAMGALRNPAKLDELLDGVTFAGTDGSQIHA